MSSNADLRPAEHAGSLDLPWEEIAHPTVFHVLNSFRNNAEAVAIRHPEATTTCDEKIKMFGRFPERYAPYGEIRIAQGAVLLIKRTGVESCLLYVSDSEDRIVWKELRRQLNLGKKDDVRMYGGDVEQIIGLPRGGVSPFVLENHQLASIMFDRRLSIREREFPAARWDFAFGRDVSVLVRPDALFDRLRSLNAPGASLLSRSPHG